MQRLKKGFTLIELLVVIAIIAILATVVIINVISARQKANDSKILSEITDANKGAIACMTDNYIPQAPISSGTAGSNRVLVPTTTVPSISSVCSVSSSGLNAVWPPLGATGAYSTWTYGNNSAITGLNSWSWTAGGTDASGKTITFTEKSTSKTGF